MEVISIDFAASNLRLRVGKGKRGSLYRVDAKSVYETGSKVGFIRGQIRCNCDVSMAISSCLMETLKKSETVTSDTISVP